MCVHVPAVALMSTININLHLVVNTTPVATVCTVANCVLGLVSVVHDFILHMFTINGYANIISLPSK